MPAVQTSVAPSVCERKAVTLTRGLHLCQPLQSRTRESSRMPHQLRRCLEAHCSVRRYGLKAWPLRLKAVRLVPRR